MPKSFNHRMVKPNPWGWSTMKYELKHNSMSDENIAYLELYFINSWLVIDINNFTKIKNYIDGGQRTHSKILSALYLFLNITLVTKSPRVTSEPIRYQRGLYVLTGFRTPHSYFCDVIQGCQTARMPFLTLHMCWLTPNLLECFIPWSEVASRSVLQCFKILYLKIQMSLQTYWIRIFGDWTKYTCEILMPPKTNLSPHPIYTPSGAPT